MNRIDRLTALLIHLQSKSRVPIEELEGRFEIGRRTVFRAIKTLIEAGIHKEIYLSDPRKTAEEKLKTIINYPIR